MMLYRTLGISMHRKCNATCKFCCMESAPHCLEKLDVDKAKKFIASSKEVSEISQISFTGGEPFLEYDNLIALIKCAKSVGKHATCVTNCFWANSDKKAFEVMSELQNAGLKRLNISYDHYHQEFVHIENINLVLRACEKLFLPVSVGIVRKKEENISDIINNLDMSLQNISLQISIPALAGAAKKNFDETTISRPYETLSQLPCQYNGAMLVLFDGRIFPCCSHFISELELSLGNYDDYDLPEILGKIKNNSLLHILRSQGLSPFVSYAINELSFKLPDTVYSPCELCSLFFNSKNIMNFKPLIHQLMGGACK